MAQLGAPPAARPRSAATAPRSGRSRARRRADRDGSSEFRPGRPRRRRRCSRAIRARPPSTPCWSAAPRAAGPGSRTRPGRRAESPALRGRRRVDRGDNPQREQSRTSSVEPHEGDHQAEHQHHSLDRHEHPDVEPEALGDARERVAEDLPVEELLAGRPPSPGSSRRAISAAKTSAVDARRNQEAAPGAGTLGRLARGAAPADRFGGSASTTEASASSRTPPPSAFYRRPRRYSSVGASAASLIHCSWSSASSPRVFELGDRGVDARRQRRVLAEQGAPLVAAGRRELADDDSIGKLRRGQDRAPSGTSTTIASTAPCSKAVTTSFDVSKICGIELG